MCTNNCSNNCHCSGVATVSVLDMYHDFVAGKMKDHSPGLGAQSTRLSDWGLGLAGETGEVVELLKHAIFHDEPVDKMQLAKELGDVVFYIQAICETTSIPFEEVIRLNAAKLQHRHGDNFSAQTSADRHAREALFSETAVFKDIATKIDRYQGAGDYNNKEVR